MYFRPNSKVETADDLYTWCTVLFSLAQAHFAKQNISTQNKYGQIYASLRGVVEKMKSGLEPLKVAERNAKPKCKYWRQSQNRKIEDEE